MRMNFPEYSCFDIRDEKQFADQAVNVFRHQAVHVPVYRRFLDLLGVNPSTVTAWEDIPYLPIAQFKTQDVIVEDMVADLVFRSSGTTGQERSRHLVADKMLYEQSFMKGFSLAYGPASDYCILALLPSYLERRDSSLVFMVEKLMRLSGHPSNGFFLDDFEKLHQVLTDLSQKRTSVILVGVTFALLDFGYAYPLHFPDLIVMETGGMKGRRKEMVREEVHAELCRSFGVTRIHSEYGMTELLSQAYSPGDGLFRCPPWMSIRVRQVDDPTAYCEDGRPGGLCITDLANVHSCAFIATEDIGRKRPGGTFEVLGRFDNADIRGCSLMAI